VPEASPPYLHHVGIIARSEAAAERVMALLGLKEHRRGYVPKYEALCIFCGGADGPDVEFVIPSGGRLKEFNRGAGGLHHIALAVPDLTQLADELAAEDIALLEETPVRGAGDFVLNFLSPVYTDGVTVEFVELDSDVEGAGGS
jgi:methylmalonyl-CoA/ethylmalonyl-CoA epimerase